MWREGSAQTNWYGWPWAESDVFCTMGGNKVLWAESFGWKMLITHTRTLLIIAYFKNFLGYEYKNSI
jgi:hypothetical protein